jgi:hypothetical protein
MQDSGVQAKDINTVARPSLGVKALRQDGGEVFGKLLDG